MLNEELMTEETQPPWLWSVKTIAKNLDYAESTVTRKITKKATFPDPVLKGRWKREDVMQWAIEEGKRNRKRLGRKRNSV